MDSHLSVRKIAAEVKAHSGPHSYDARVSSVSLDQHPGWLP